jgi:plasmid replication initiation protein
VEKLEDILTRFGNKIASAGEQDRAGQGDRSRLLPERHPNRDFFVADILDWALKDDRHSMEHPMFSLAKNPDHRARHYEHNGNSITIEPGHHGLATIWDKDILIYAVSQLIEGMNQNRAPSRTIRMIAYDLLVSTNRHTGGGDYKQLEEAFERLAGTRIRTNITTNGERIRHGFGLIDEWKIIDKVPGTGRMVAVELTLSQWLYNAVLAREVLTLNRNYFRLRGGLERRLYELARKHCGHQVKWSISLELLHKKSGTAGIMREFRRKIKALAQSDELPDYRLQYEAEADTVSFYSKNPQKLVAAIAATSGFQTRSD